MKQEIKNELKNIKSTLTELQESKIFEVDNDYFDKMQSSILSKIEKDNSNNYSNKFFTIKQLIGIAASVIILFGIVWQMNRDKSENNEIADEELYEYLLENIDDFDQDLLAEFIPEKNLEYEETEYLSIEEIDEYFENNIESITEEEIKILF